MAYNIPYASNKISMLRFKFENRGMSTTGNSLMDEGNISESETKIKD
jgi:hypothetical protein